MSILDDYKKRLKTSFDLSKSHWDRAIDNYKHYLGRIDVGNTSEGDYPFSSKITIPVSYEIVETVMPRLIGRNPDFTAIAIEPDDVPYEQVAKMAVEMGYDNSKLALMGEPIYLKLQRGTKEQLITGNVVYRAYWRRESMKRVRYNASLEAAGIKDSEDITKVWETASKLNKTGEITYGKKFVDSPYLDDFDVKHLPFFFFFPDVEMIDTGKMRYMIERDYKTFEALADEAEIFGYDKATMDEIAMAVREKRSGFTPDITKDFMKDYNDLFASVNPSTFLGEGDKVELLMVDKMWMGDKVAVFVNEKWNLTGDKTMDNPYDVKKNPFIFGHDVTIPHSYFSLGEIDAMKKLEDANNDILNMRFDNLLSAMLNFWLVNPNYVDANDEFQPIPNSITFVSDTERAVRQITGANVTPTVYREAQELYSMIQRITGINDYVKGEEGQTLAGRTYGGLRLVQEMANARFIVKNRLFEELTLKAMGYFILEMSRQFINKDRVTRQFGETGEIVDKKLEAGKLKAIKGFMDMKVIPNSSKVIDEQAEAIKLNALADRFMAQKGPFADIPSEVFDKFLLKYLPLYGIHDAVYWVREIKNAREKKLIAEKVTPPPINGATPPPIMGGMPTQEVIQPDQIAGGQPNPLGMINNSLI